MKKFKIFIYTIIIVCVISSILILSGVHKYQQQREEIDLFLNKFINSAVSKNNFHKQRFLRETDYEYFKKYINKFTPSFDIKYLDYSWYVYEYKVTFSNGKDFYFEIGKTKNEKIYKVYSIRELTK